MRDELSHETEWGGEVKRNLNSINAFLYTGPAGVKEAIWGARLEDGSPMASDKGVLKWLSTLARQINPLGTVVPDVGSTQIDTVDNEIAKIMVEMKKGPKGPYWSGDGSKKMQNRLLELNEMKEKHDSIKKK